MLRGIWNARWGRALGLLFVFAGQLQYVSWSSREILGRWSVPAFAAISAMGVLVVLAVLRSSFLSFGNRRVAGHAMPPWLSALEAAVLLLGLAYFLAASDDPDAGGRVLELNFFGSFYAPSIALEWLAACALAASAVLAAWQHLRQRAPGAVMLLISVLGLALLGEGATRLAAILAPTTQGFPTASTEMWMRRHGSVNAEGFRDAPHSLEKPAGTRRVLLIGDSFTFGVGVNRREDRASDRLEVLLDGGGKQVEVINAGLPYTHTLQHIATLERMLLYDPDVIVLVYVYNDIDYIRSGDRPSSVTGATASIWDRFNPPRVIFSNSFLYQQIYIRARHIFWRFEDAEAMVESPYADDAVVERHLKDLRLFVERAAAHGAQVRIASFHLPFVTEDADPEKRAFRDRMIEAGLPVWPLKDVFDGLEYGDLIVNQMDHHPNELANERLAAALAPRIESLWTTP